MLKRPLHATARMILASLSAISPISSSLMISGGESAMRVAGYPHHQSVIVKGAVHRHEGAFAGTVRVGGEVDRGDEADRADVEDVGQAAQGMDGIGPALLERLRPFEEPFLRVEVERRESGGAGQRMGRISVAVEQFDDMFRPLHESLLDEAPRDHAAHRHGARGDAFGEGDHIRHDAIALRREGMAETAEAGDHFIENEQDAIFVADRAQPLQIALRGRQHAGRARHRLDDDGGDGRGIVQGDDVLELVGEMGAPFGLAARKSLFGAIIGMRQMIDAGEKRAEEFAVRRNAADRNAAEPDAVIAAHPADEPRARAMAADIVIGERDLQSGVDRFRARIHEEDAVEIARRQRRDARRQLEGFRIGELERRCIIDLGGLGLDRRDDRCAVVTGIAAPHAGGAVEHGAAVERVIIHAGGAGDEARVLLEGAIGRERHPKGFEIVGGALSGRRGRHRKSFADSLPSIARRWARVNPGAAERRLCLTPLRSRNRQRYCRVSRGCRGRFSHALPAPGRRVRPAAGCGRRHAFSPRGRSRPRRACRSTRHR